MPSRRSLCHLVEVHTMCGSMVSYFLPLDSRQASCTNKAPMAQYNDSLRVGRSGDRIPLRARFSAPVQTGPGAHPPSHLYSRCGVIPRGKAAGEWRWPPTPIQCSPSGSSCQVIVWILPFIAQCCAASRIGRSRVASSREDARCA